MKKLFSFFLKNWIRIGFIIVPPVVLILLGYQFDWYVFSKLEMRELVTVTIALIVFVIAFDRNILFSRQTDQATQQAKTATQQADTAVKSHLNERYQTGTEMLGNPVLSVRIGGIYTLENLADERPELYHIRVMKLFCFTARFPPHDTPEPDNESETEDKTVKLREDIQEIMTIVGKRKKERIKDERDEDYHLDLRGANLSRVYLLGANLSGANLIKANLSGANLFKANLSGAKLIKTNLSGANLFKANLSGAYLLGADLSGAYLGAVNLSGEDMLEINLSGAELRRANLSRANMGGANLLGANLDKADLSKANLRRANISEAYLDEANLSEAYLDEANLSGAHLEGADLSRAELEEANLSGATLSGAYLSRAILSGVHLEGADLSGADLFGANLSGASLMEANLSRAELSCVQGLKQEELNKAIADPSKPPTLTGAIDSVTEQPLVWQKTEA